MNSLKLFALSKTIVIAPFIITALLFVFAACFGPKTTPAPIPTPTLTPPLSEQILELFLNLPEQYLASSGYLELAHTNILLNSPTECVRQIFVWVYDDKGNFFSRNSGIGYIYGPYVLTSITLIPEFPDPDTIEIASLPPGTSQETLEQYEKIIEQLKEQLKIYKNYKIESALAWDITSTGLDVTTQRSGRMQVLEIVKIEDPALAKELRESGLVILKRLPRDVTGKSMETPECSPGRMTVGNSSALKTFDILYVLGLTHNSYDSTLIFTPTRGSYTVSPSDPEKESFYFEGSVIETDLVSPIFAFDKNSQQFAAVGIVVANGGKDVETRGVALKIEYFLDLMKRVGLITINASPINPSSSVP